MELAGHLAFDQGLSDLTGFEQDGREFAVVGLINEAAAFVDITNPYNPIEVGRISGSPRIHRDLKYWNRHVYIGTEASDGVKVVSVDDPDNPILVHTITDFGSSHNIHIDADGYLYVVGASDHDIWIYELTDHPETPQFVGSWDGEYLHDIEVYNNKIYGAGISSGQFYIIDVSDKTTPTTILSHYTGGVSTHDCAVTDDEQYLITADETLGGHIKIWDISDYDNINLVSEYMTYPEHSVHNVYVRPGTNLVIMSYYVDGTRVLDISDPINPVEVGYFDTSELTGLFDGNWGTYAYLPSGYIISSDRQNVLYIFSSPLTMDNVDFDGCPIAPTTPYITTSESFIDSIKLSWDTFAEVSVDSTTSSYDFEGYRLYRSLDHGETWGDEEEDKIYDDHGVHVGWQPHVQFDSNTGIKNDYIDTGLYPHLEYCYVVTSFDPGLIPGFIAPNGWTYENGHPSMESHFSNMVCLYPDAQDIYTPYSGTLFKENEANIGWAQITYFPYNVDTENSSLYQFEIEAEVDSNTYMFSETLDPKIYVYTADIDGNPNDFTTTSTEGITTDSLNTLLDIPGMIYDTLNSLIRLPEYISQGFPIYSINDEIEDEWLYALGMYIKIDNYISEFPPSSIAVLDTIIWVTEPIYSYTGLLSVNLEYSNQDVKRAYFNYLIEFGNPGLDTALQVAPPSACSGYETNTLLPFRVTNLITGNKVMLKHLDKGINGEEPDSDDLGYGDCEYTRNERVKFVETDIDLTNLTEDYNTYDLSLDWLIQSEADNFIYPWVVGDSIIIIPRKMLHDGDSWLIDTDLFNQSALNNSDSAVKPESFKLGTPYPNPFNPVIAIEYSLSYTSKIKLTIYDLLGRQVEILYNGKQYLGNYTISWDASNYSSGVYFIKMNVGDSQSPISQSRKVVLLK